MLGGSLRHGLFSADAGEDCYKAALPQLYLNLCVYTAGTINTVRRTWLLNPIFSVHLADKNILRGSSHFVKSH